MGGRFQGCPNEQNGMWDNGITGNYPGLSWYTPWIIWDMIGRVSSAKWMRYPTDEGKTIPK